MDTSKVTRFEIVDQTPCPSCAGRSLVEVGERLVPCPGCQGRGMRGRVVIARGDLEFSVSLQDDGKTLKVFIREQDNLQVS